VFGLVGLELALPLEFLTMGRPKREWVSKTEGCYHIISRTVGGEFLLGDGEKEYFLHLLRHLPFLLKFTPLPS